MADANVKTLNLAGWKQARKALGRRLQRNDFPATKEGWTSFCDYRIWIYTKAVSRSQRALDYYKSVRAGEHLANVVAKVDAFMASQKELEAVKAELAALKAAQNQPKS